MVSYPTDTLITVEDCIHHALEMTIAPNDKNYYDWDGNVTLGEKKGFTELISQVQIVGTNLYDFVSEQCQLNGYGFN